jgi:hypothetical protein
MMSSFPVKRGESRSEGENKYLLTPALSFLRKAREHLANKLDEILLKLKRA